MADAAEPAGWDETNILHDFGDGWLICLDKTKADISRNATQTRTCVSGGHITGRLIEDGKPHRPEGPQPTQEELLEKAKEKVRKLYPHLEERHVNYEAQAMIRYGSGTNEPVYRLGHVRNPEGMAVSTILFIHKKVYQPDWNGGRVAYQGSKDIGTEKFITLPDGERYRIAEVRYGEEGVKRVAAWFRKATHQKIEGRPYTIRGW